MSDTVPIANYRTKLEAEFAAGLLAGAQIPYVIQSMEGLLHGPLGFGATLLVRSEDAERARDLLEVPDPDAAPSRAILLDRFSDPAAADRAVACLNAAGLPALARDGEQTELFVRREHARRARQILDEGRDA